MSRQVARRSALAAGLTATLALLLRPGSQQDAAAAEHALSRPGTRLAHLLRRAGFGATADELVQFEAMGYEATVDYLLNYDAVPDPIEDRLAPLALDLAENREHLKRWWMVRMVHTTRPLQEKMVLFWHGLLTSSFSKVNRPPLMLRQNEFFRANALGSLDEVLTGISKDPAMPIWLDGRGSRRQQPNENYARELMELFTLGEGRYTEQDVQEAARAFTGWVVTKEGEPRYNPRAHDDGEKTFLGQTGNFGGDDIVDIILQQPAAADYIARRLFSFLAYPNPEPEVIAPLAGVLTESGYSIRALVRAILLSDAFSSDRAYRALVRPPVDLVVSTHRLLGIESDGQFAVQAARQMGQDLFNPPNVAGWPGGPAWLNSSTWLYRVNFAHAATTRRRNPLIPALDLNRLTAERGFQSPGDLVQYFVDLLVDGNLYPDARAALEGYLFDGQPLELGEQSLDRKGRALVYLLLASPEYQLM